MPRCVIRLNTSYDALIGVQLVTDRKEPSEVLEAYDNVKLGLSGNSTHLVPWHTKLGFRRCANVCTLSSLTPDGGNIAMMKLRIEKVCSISVSVAKNLVQRHSGVPYSISGVYPRGRRETEDWADGREGRDGCEGRMAGGYLPFDR